MSETNSSLLSAENLECTRDDRLLFNGLSFSLGSGEVLQIEGPNGSGKTSLLRILSGLRRADAGDVRWLGDDIRQTGSKCRTALWEYPDLADSPWHHR